MAHVSNKQNYAKVHAFEIEEDETTVVTNSCSTLTDDDGEEVGSHIQIDLRVLCALLRVMILAFCSLVSLIPYALMVRVILNLTSRWYFCAITATLQFVEKATVFLIIRRLHFESELILLPSGGLFAPVCEEEQCQHVVTGQAAIPKAGAHSAGLVRRCVSTSFRSICVLLLEFLSLVIMSTSYIWYIPNFCRDLIQNLFMEADGAVAEDWEHVGNQFSTIAVISKICGLMYLIVIGLTFFALFEYLQNGLIIGICRSRSSNGRGEVINMWRSCRYVHRYMNNDIFAKIFKLTRKFSFISCLLTGFILLLSLSSAWIYLVDHPLPINNNVGPNCDPLDTTECMLPFPSNFFTIDDPHSQTGFKVNVEVDALQSMYKGRTTAKHTSQLNKQDGFSTSGTILFYLEGIKESQERGINGTSKLIGPEEIEASTTEKSLTLLVDLELGELVPHFAEIDYLDEERPLVFLQAAKSLEHNRRYAVALMNALDSDGNILQPTEYLTLLLDREKSKTLQEKEQHRGHFYRSVVLPQLFAAAPWLEIENTVFQMLFDFHTASVDSRVGQTRKVVEASINSVSNEKWGGWGNHNVRNLDLINFKTCVEDGNSVGKIVHLEVDVPTFLVGTGREKKLQMDDLQQGYTSRTSPFKIVVLVPCSLTSGQMHLKAVIDYGHGFLTSRKELLDITYLHELANTEGYIMVSSNWRGFSHLDYGIIIKAFVAEPNLLDSLEANIMQGFGFKAAIQHFVCNHLLSMDVMSDVQHEYDNVRFFFYGVSLGGILGSPYTSHMSNLGILDGAVLTSPGTPLSLLMSRSTKFKDFKFLLLMGLHNSRQVRIFVSFLQMAIDSVEGPSSSLYAEETADFKILIQAGIGDPVVSTIGSETMARNYNAAAFSTNPKNIFGLESMTDKSTICITEILYTNELSMLPSKNVGTTESFNDVHWCVRQDTAMLEQLVSFINKKEFLDICAADGCIREGAWC